MCTCRGSLKILDPVMLPCQGVYRSHPYSMIVGESMLRDKCQLSAVISMYVVV